MNATTTTRELSTRDDGDGDGDDVDALFDNSAGLGIRETILEMIMADGAGGEERAAAAAEEDAGFLEKEFTDGLFHLCLTVLSNALIVMGEEPRAAGSTWAALPGRGEHCQPKPASSQT